MGIVIVDRTFGFALQGQINSCAIQAVGILIGTTIDLGAKSIWLLETIR